MSNYLQNQIHFGETRWATFSILSGYLSKGIDICSGAALKAATGFDQSCSSAYLTRQDDR
jgi:hypothetical protein